MFKGVELARRAGQRRLEVVSLLNGAEESIFLGKWSDTRAAITELGQRVLPLDQRNISAATKAAGGAHGKP